MDGVVRAAERKVALPVTDLLVRGILSGVFLGYATSLAMVVQSQGLPPFLGAAVFPVGIALIVLLGLELATGNFASLTMGLTAGRVRVGELIRNWGWVYAANLTGAALYAVLFCLVLTRFGASSGGDLGEQVRQLTEKKTLAYAAIGPAGWAVASVSGVLCNWLVALGTAVLPLASRSTLGKIGALWLPIMTFFALGYEHAIVNMYVIPAGMLLGASVSLTDWWLWNQIPVTIGNIIGGAVFAGAALHVTYGRRGPSQPPLRDAGGSVSTEFPERDHAPSIE